MKINKGISVLLASMLIGGMLVGCSNNSNSDTTKVSTKTVKEVTKDDTEVETTKDKEKEFPPQDNNKSSEKQVNTKKDNDNVTVKKDTNQKEIKSTKEVTQKKSNENTTKDKSEKNNSTQKKTTSNTDTKEKETPKKEEPKQKGYWVTCSNGHKVWTVNGDYDCQQCYDDYMNQKDDEKNKCSICGSHVGVKQMCECDGTIHHRSCHVDAYICPSCGRTGLNNDPDVYGCPYCGYPNEEHQESSDVEEYNDEVDTIDDTNEGINY